MHRNNDEKATVSYTAYLYNIDKDMYHDVDIA